jgi:hypothetical protein
MRLVCEFGIYRLAIGRPLSRPRTAYCSFDLVGERHEVIMDASVHVALDWIRGKVAHQRCFCSFLPQLLDRCKVILHETRCSIPEEGGSATGVLITDESH